METFEDILKEPEKQEVTEAPPEKTEVVEEEKPQSRRKAHQTREWTEQGRDPETGQYVAKEEKEVKEAPEVKAEVKEQPKVEFSEKEKALLRNMEEERKKRQALEAELAQYRQKKEPEKQEEKKTFWDDPEGHFKTVEQRIAQRELAMTLKVSEQLARSKYPDFDDKISVFAEDLKTVPGLHAQWLASPDPAEFAYKHGHRVKELREVGDLDKYREKIEKETRAKLEAEFKAKQEAFEKQRAALPPSLSDVKGAAKQNAPVWTGPTPFSDILK